VVRLSYIQDARFLKVNWLVFITERVCVYCAVRTGSLYIIYVYFLIRTRTKRYVARTHARNKLDQVPATQIHCMSIKANYSHNCLTRLTATGGAIAQAVSRWPLAAKARARFQVSPCEICGGQSGPATGFSPSTSVIPCQYHSIIALCLFIRHRGSISLAVGSTVKLHTHTPTHTPTHPHTHTHTPPHTPTHPPTHPHSHSHSPTTHHLHTNNCQKYTNAHRRPSKRAAWEGIVNCYCAVVVLIRLVVLTEECVGTEEWSWGPLAPVPSFVLIIFVCNILAVDS
jgi:hypothetical protein